MNLQQRINAFVKLGEKIVENDYFKDHFQKILISNPWFTKENIKHRLTYVASQLKKNKIEEWLSLYDFSVIKRKKTVLIVLAGNIPLVGFHDFLSSLIVGHKLVVKMSSKDNVIMTLIINELINISPYYLENIEIVNDIRKNNFDAVIATGNDQSAKYFNYYFKNSKRIIRKNRTSVAILSGEESSSELEALTLDIFLYFGLGCRNVSKIYVPYNYDLNKLFKVFYRYKDIINHKKYANNYNYNKTIFLMGNNKLLDNGFILLKEDNSVNSPLAMLYYEFYKSYEDVKHLINRDRDNIQCIVSKKDVYFGLSQTPELSDYSDGVDVINFLINI